MCEREFFEHGGAVSLSESQAQRMVQMRCPGALGLSPGEIVLSDEWLGVA